QIDRQKYDSRQLDKYFMMRSKWIVLVLLLELSVMIAAIEASVGNNDHVNTTTKQIALRGHRFKRYCCCYPCYIILAQKQGATGQKEISRNWWLHISLLLFPMSMSWMKSIFY
ncbi:unnamed protein product, partial [Onchocerca ochengi]|uniref:Secreted protein n=1 Tax=Onchocerca ochengi TaxID=42157 RepID=A0A182EUM4_ONCOC